MPLEMDLAIYKRLTGYPLDSQGKPLTDGAGVPTNRERIGPPDLNPYERTYDATTGTFTTVLPTLPSYGIRIPLMKGPFRGGAGITSFSPDAIPLFDKFDESALRQVPVFDENITGRKIDDIWPCVTFRWFGLDFDPKTFVYHDPIGTPDTGSPLVQIKNAAGTVIEEGRAKNLRRPHPESWPMQYVITAYAKNKIELGLICAEIARLFPARGAINVTFADGTSHPCDMLLLRTDTLDEGADQVVMTRGPEEQRNYARAFVYSVESYLDNTVNKYGVTDTRSVVAVRERLLELDVIMADLSVLQGSYKDMNLGELLPITA
jgi:hypothetical protein